MSNKKQQQQQDSFLAQFAANISVFIESQTETNKQQVETNKQLVETNKQQAETNKQQAETNKNFCYFAEKTSNAIVELSSTVNKVVDRMDIMDQKIDKVIADNQRMETRLVKIEEHIVYGIDVLERTFPESIDEEKKAQYKERIKACQDKIDELVEQGIKAEEIAVRKHDVLDKVEEIVSNPLNYEAATNNLMDNYHLESWLDSWRTANYARTDKGLDWVKKIWDEVYGKDFPIQFKKTNRIKGLRCQLSKKVNELIRQIFKWHQFNGELPDYEEFTAIHDLLVELYFTYHMDSQTEIEGVKFSSPEEVINYEPQKNCKSRVASCEALLKKPYRAFLETVS